ncbi:hypothetical protein [Natronobeatus ordinarius]|uniref:hypothetical protein n=1 Tax=Natronobeatus ordinarius TaxID=2963433 RepID=UPI0020CF5286|nr:hypothetical protein [Natronobeatus ordinarius]
MYGGNITTYGRRSVLKTAGTLIITAIGAVSVAGADNDEADGGENVLDFDTEVDLEADFEFEGAGQRVTDEVELDDGPVIAMVEYDGDASIHAHAIPQADQDMERVIVMTDDGPRGVGGVMATEGPYVFEIDLLFVDFDLDESEIEWTITIVQPVAEEGDAIEPPVEFEGEVSTLLGPVRLDGTEVAAATHDAEGNFQIDALPQEAEFADAMFFETGEFEGETTVDTEGVNWITVEAGGEWTLSIE